jgi:hypothetical protein
MASATRPRIKAHSTTKGRSVVPRPEKIAKKELLDDLMEDAKKCLATKNRTEKKTFFLAIKKIADS